MTKNSTKEPVSSTVLLMTITVCAFVAMYVLAMIIWGSGFLDSQQFFDLFNIAEFRIIKKIG